MNELRLSPTVHLSVEYSDANEFGSPIATKLQKTMGELMSDLHRQIDALDPAEAVARGASLLRKFRDSEAYRGILGSHGGIADGVLYPDPALCKPKAVHFTNADTSEHFSFEVNYRVWPEVHAFIAQLAGDSPLRDDHSMAVNGWQELEKSLIPQLAVRDMVVRADSDRLVYQSSTRSRWSSCSLSWLGHNSAVVRSKQAAVVVDPWLLPVSRRYPATFLPAQRAELGGVDAIVITHSHPDHFDPGTLLQFRPDTVILVPRVERESLLCAAMKMRLVELGFTDVRELNWWECVQIGDIEIVALPFYGEQPTSGEQLYPEVRNAGNAYLIRSPQVSCAFTADCGRDFRGDVREVALEAYRRFGAADFLFSGYRGWNIYPVQLVKSSVPEYVLFVPPDLYDVRQSLMSDAGVAIDTAEHWHARYFVPYADGGAPWYWEIGLGPVLDTCEGHLQEWTHFDPLPERVLYELSARSAPTPTAVAASRVQGMLLRPGESISMVDGSPRIVECDHHTWPWKVMASAQRI